MPCFLRRKARYGAVRSLRFVCVMVLSAIMVAGVVGGRPVMAQEASSMVQVSDAVVQVQEPWRGHVSPTSLGSVGDVFVFSGTNDLLLLGVFPEWAVSDDPIADVRGELAATLGEVTDVDRGASFALQGSVVDGVPYGHFSLLYADRTPGVVEVLSYISPVSTFASGLDTLRDSVAIDGKPIFDGVNGASLQGLLADAIGAGDAAADASLAPLLVDTEEEAAVLPEDDGQASEIRPGARLVAALIMRSGVIGGAGETGGFVESGDFGDGDDVGETEVFAEEDAVDANTWVSPTFGTEISWGDEWMLAPAMEPSGDADFDTVHLVRKDNSRVEFSVSVSPASAKSIDSWVGEVEFAISLSPINTIAVAESSGWAGGVVWHDPHWVFVTDFSTLHDGSAMVMGQLKAPVELAQEAYGSVDWGIMIDGGPAFSYITAGHLGAVHP